MLNVGALVCPEMCEACEARCETMQGCAQKCLMLAKLDAMRGCARKCAMLAKPKAMRCGARKCTKLAMAQCDAMVLHCPRRL